MQPYWGPVLRCCKRVGHGEGVYAYSRLAWDTISHLQLRFESLHQIYPSFIIMCPYESLSITFIDLCAWMQHVTGQAPRERKTMAPVEKFNLIHPLQFHFSPNDMFYILINNRFYFFVPSQPQRQLFQINMWPPASRAGSEWVEGKMRGNRQQTE